MERLENDKITIIRGGGDLATGIAYSLYKAGFKIIILETQFPSSIRRKVSLSEAVYDNRTKVEDIEAILCDNIDTALNMIKIKNYNIPVLIDSDLKCLNKIKPYFIIDSIIAKKNLGLKKDMAKYTIALGPGFMASKDCDIVIETMRGHSLGKMYLEGEAIANTGIPGNIAGKSAERVIHANSEGIIENIKDIGDFVYKDEIIAYITNNNIKNEVIATFDGIIRGIIRNGYKVKKGLKIADIDPRKSEYENCFTISDKSRSLGNAVLMAMLYLINRDN